MITKERLKEVLKYSSDTGLFTWKIRNSNRIKIGDVAGKLDKDGYVIITIDSNKYRAHRLAHLYMTGSIPKYVDHRNVNPSDNRWRNLRESTVSENGLNKRISSANKSGVKGVHWCKRDRAWVAQLFIEGRGKTIGHFPDLIGAELAVRKARQKHHGEFANHG